MLNLKNRLIEQKFGLDDLELLSFCELQAGKYELTSLSIPAYFWQYSFNAAYTRLLQSLPGFVPAGVSAHRFVVAWIRA